MSPEFKIITYVFFITSLFFIRAFNIYLLACVPFFILLARIPLKTLRRGWLPVSLLLAFTFLSNMFYQEGRILFNSGGLIITDEGMHTAVIRTLRVFFMIAGAKILMASTSTGSLIGALKKLCAPLERLKVPVEDFFQVMELTMKSLPMLKEQTACMYRDKMRRESGRGYLAKAKTVSSLLVPLLVNSIQTPDRYFQKRRSDEVISPCREDAYDKET